MRPSKFTEAQILKAIQQVQDGSQRWLCAGQSGSRRPPVWSPDGKKIFYAEGQKFIAASVVTMPTFAVSSRQVLFEGNFLFGSGHASFDVARDGKSFLMLRPVAGNEEQVVVAHNFMTELRARRRSQAAPR